MNFIALGKNIRKKRKSLKLTQEALAEKCNCSSGHIGMVENAKTIPSLEMTVHIANALGTAVDILIKYYTLKHNGKAVDIVYTFNCGNHKRLGKAYCSSHYIKAKDIEKFILDDVKEMASCVTLDEDAVRKKYLERKAKLTEDELIRIRNELNQKRRRCDKLDQLIETAFEEKISGNMPEDLCVKLIERYTSERQHLLDEIDIMDKQGIMISDVENDIDDFIARVKKHMSDITLTRALCFELIDKIVIGKAISGEPQNIEIYYKVDLGFTH